MVTHKGTYCISYSFKAEAIETDRNRGIGERRQARDL